MILIQIKWSFDGIEKSHILNDPPMQPQHADGIDNVSVVNDGKLFYNHQADPKPFIPPIHPINDAYNMQNHNSKKNQFNQNQSKLFLMNYQTE